MVIKKQFLKILLCLVILLGYQGLFPEDDTQVPRYKQTVLGLYLTAQEAFKKWQAAPAKIILLAVRTPEEYLFVGHADQAYNIPFMLLKDKWYKDKTGPMIINPDFLPQVKKKFKEISTIFVMCRSGGRSASAVNALAKAGYKKAYSIVDGFEGDKVTDRKSKDYGKRRLNGWKNSEAPWTYKLDPRLVYNPN